MNTFGQVYTEQRFTSSIMPMVKASNVLAFMTNLCITWFKHEQMYCSRIQDPTCVRQRSSRYLFSVRFKAGDRQLCRCRPIFKLVHLANPLLTTLPPFFIPQTTIFPTAASAQPFAKEYFLILQDHQPITVPPSCLPSASASRPCNPRRSRKYLPSWLYRPFLLYHQS